MKKIVMPILFVSLFSAVLFAVTNDITYYTDTNYGTKVSDAFTASDTVYSKPIFLDNLEEAFLVSNITGGAGYVHNDVQAQINGTWVTVATDSAGLGYSSYTMRNNGTFTIPTNTIRLQTRVTRSSGTVTVNQQISGK